MIYRVHVLGTEIFKNFNTKENAEKWMKDFSKENADSYFSVREKED